MADYYIPLSTLVPLLPDLPILAGIPGWADAMRGVGVRGLRETWNDDHVVTTGRAVIGADTRIHFFGLELLFGLGAADQTELDFEYAADRSSLLESLVQKVFEETEVPASVDVLDTEGDPAQAQVTFLLANDYADADSALLDADAPARVFRLVIRGIGARLRLPTAQFQLGQHVKQGDVIVAVEPAPGDLPVDIALPSFTLIIDSVRGVDLRLDDDQALDCPPFLLRDLGIGFEVDEVKVDLSRETGFHEVVGRAGFDVTWCGVHIAAARVFNLDKLLPFLPSKIEVTHFLIDGEGTTGAFEAAWTVEEDPSNTDLFRLGAFALEWERGRLIRGTATVTLRVGGIGNEWAGIGPDGDLALSTTLRHNPDLTGLAAYGWDFSVRTPGVEDKGLFYLGPDTLALVTGGAVAGLAVAAAIEQDSGLGWAAAGLSIAAVLEANHNLVLERLSLDGLGIRVYHREVGGQVVQFWDVVLDLQLALSLDLDLGFVLLPRLETDTPIGLSVRGLVLQIAVDPPAGLDIPKVDILLDHESGVSFDVGEQTRIDLGVLVRVTKAALGRWDEGIWVELGLEVDQATLDVGFSVSSIRLWFRNDGSLARVTPGDVGFSLLVPGALYAKGKVALGDVTEIEARGFLVQAAPPATPDAVFKRETYVWDVGVGLRHEVLDGIKSVVVSADLEWSMGVPIAFCPAVAWYGINALVAVNAQPATGAQPLSAWFLDKAPRNQITVGKFEGAVDALGVGVGAVFGSTAGSGRFFSVKAGIMLQFPGPILMISGTGNLLSPRPSMGDTSSGAFAAIVVIDMSDHGYVSLDVRVDYKVPSSGALLSITVPVEFFAGWGGQGFHLYLGRDKPLAKRVRVRVISIFDLSGYLMLDCATIPNLAETGVDIPGFAIAVGGRAEWEWGIKARFLKIYFYLRVELNLALSLPDPVLFFAGVLLEGGLVVKVFGFGFEFGVHVDASFLARNPWRLWGSFQITIGLPWPFPDINVTVPFSLGDDEVPLPEPPMAVAGLTLMDRGSQQPRKVDVGASLAGTAQIDPVLALSFHFPMRNGSGAVGTFNLDGTNTRTWWLAAGDDASGVKGYRFDLTDLRLQRLTPTGWRDAPIAAPASWTPRGSVRAKGGEALRDELTLLDWNGPLSAHMMGTSADYWRDVLDTWDPCPARPRPTTTCFDFNPSDVGVMPPGRTLGAGPSIQADPNALDEAALLLLRMLGLLRHPGLVEPAPATLPSLPSVTRVLRLPMASGAVGSAVGLGAMMTGAGASIVLPGATLTWALAHAASVDLLVPIATRVRVSFFLRDALVLTDSEGKLITQLQGSSTVPDPTHHAAVVSRPGHRHLRFACPSLSDRVVIEVLAIEAKGAQVEPAWLYRACVMPEADVVAHEEATRTRKAWQNFWAQLVAQQAATSDSLLLEPDSAYRLRVGYTWGTLEGDGTTEVATGSGEAIFDFQTTAEAPTSLRPRAVSVGGGEDDWDIDSAPADGSFGVYPTRALGLLFRDPRTEAVFGKFGRKLVLHLVDEDGIELSDRIAMLAAEATSRPAYQEALWARVTGLACTPDGVSSLRRSGTAHFATVLALETWYDAMVVSVPRALDLAALPAGFRWDAHPVVHRFRFRTSRFLSLADHLAACVIVDEICDAPPALAEVSLAAGATTGLVQDDQALDAVIAALHLPPRAPPWRAPPTPSTAGTPPRPPELTRIWRSTPSGHEVVAVLLDSPEPFGADGVDIQLLRGGTPTGTLHVRGQSGARSLLFRAAGGQLGALGAGPWALSVVDRWWDVLGAPSTETQTRPFTVPAQPDAFGPEED